MIVRGTVDWFFVLENRLRLHPRSERIASSPGNAVIWRAGRVLC